jgi:hypothetical protein
MAVILFSYLTTAYIFSGLICLLALLSHLNRIGKLSMWRRLLVVALWPVWIMSEIRS